METTLRELTNSFISSIIAAYLSSLDQAIVEDKAGRRKKGIVIERKGDKRELYTVFGQLRFRRTYFRDKRNQNYAYLLDKAVGLESYDRVSGTVAVGLVEHAQEASYGESSRHVTGGAISRQTVMKKLRLLKDLKIKPPSDKRKVKVLHVDADEDHVPHYISSYGKTAEELWLEAVNWIYNTYDVDNIERVYLHGDGALWIKEGIS